MGRCILAIVLGLAVVVLLAAGFVLGGFYDVAADVPHAGPTMALLDAVRSHSVATHARDLAVPADLGDAKRIAAGAAEYQEMCSQCHLAPGMEKTEISQGLYPTAPELARGLPLDAAEIFWAVKHGIKFTAMPAWGKTHDDALIWNIVAFVRKLPSLTPAQYKTMVANAPEEHDEMMRGMTMPADKDSPPASKGDSR